MENKDKRQLYSKEGRIQHKAPDQEEPSEASESQENTESQLSHDDIDHPVTPDNLEEDPTTAKVNNDPTNIETAAVTGPLVIFYGPRNVGKTVALLRLSEFIQQEYDVTPAKDYRGDDKYEETVKKFEQLRNRGLHAPEATGEINFLMLNVNQSGKHFCKILEAPGEHFFDPEKPNADYLHYLNQLFTSDIRKIYVFFFEIELFKNDTDRQNYANKIRRLIQKHVNIKRDKIIILCNKCDKFPDMYTNNNRPSQKLFREKLYDSPYFNALKGVLKKRGRVDFVAFSAGEFSTDSNGLQTFAFADPYFPQTFWKAIYANVKGGFSLFS